MLGTPRSEYRLHFHRGVAIKMISESACVNLGVGKPAIGNPESPGNLNSGKPGSRQPWTSATLWKFGVCLGTGILETINPCRRERLHRE